MNGCVARVFSKDLARWELLPPISSPARYVDMEVPQYFELNDFHYLLFSTGTVIDTPSRVATRGTYYLVAESKEGPYEAPEDNLLIGSGEGRFDCYVGKVIFTGREWLLYHHIIGKRTAFAAPKVVRQDAQGRLSLERWPGLDALCGETILSADSPGTVVNAQHGIPIGSWRRERGRLIGDAGPTISGWLFDEPAEDCALRATLDVRESVRAGVLFRMAHVEEPRAGTRGLALCLDRKRNVIQLCEAQIGSRRSVELTPLDNVYLPTGGLAEIEVFLRAEYVEIYWQKRPLFILNAAHYPLTGRMGFFADRGKTIVENVEVRDIPEKLRQ